MNLKSGSRILAVELPIKSSQRSQRVFGASILVILLNFMPDKCHSVRQKSFPFFKFTSCFLSFALSAWHLQINVNIVYFL